MKNEKWKMDLLRVPVSPLLRVSGSPRCVTGCDRLVSAKERCGVRCGSTSLKVLLRNASSRYCRLAECWQVYAFQRTDRPNCCIGGKLSLRDYRTQRWRCARAR